MLYWTNTNHTFTEGSEQFDWQRIESIKKGDDQQHHKNHNCCRKWTSWHFGNRAGKEQAFVSVNWKWQKIQFQGLHSIDLKKPIALWIKQVHHHETRVQEDDILRVTLSSNNTTSVLQRCSSMQLIHPFKRESVEGIYDVKILWLPIQPLSL